MDPSTGGIEFDDLSLSNDFFECFGSCAAVLSGMNVRVRGGRPPYSVNVGGNVVAGGLSRARVVGAIDELLDKALRACVAESICTLHSFGVVTCGGGAVAIVGVSGSGKTTLGLASLLNECHLLGDEYGYLDLNAGTYWHASYPIPVKDGTGELLGINLPDGLASLSRRNIHSTLINAKLLASSLGSEYFEAIPLRLSAVLVPQRREDVLKPKVNRMSVADMPRALLPSLQGEGSRGALFKRFLSMVSKYGIDVMSIEYSDAISVSRLIAEKGAIW